MNDLVIALIGGSVGWYFSHASMMASEDASVLNGYIEEVEACSQAVERYWLTVCGSPEEEQALAAVVRARFAALSVFYGDAPQYLRQSYLQDYHVKQRRFFGEATGGQFESLNRPIEPQRAIEAYRISREIAQILRLARREQLSPAHWIKLRWNKLVSKSDTQTF